MAKVETTKGAGAVEEAAPARQIKFMSIYPEYRLYIKPEIKTKMQDQYMRVDTLVVQREHKVQFQCHVAWIPEDAVAEAKAKEFYGIHFIDGRELKANLKSKDKRNQSLAFCRQLTRNGKRVGLGDKVLEYEDLIEELAEGKMER